MKSVAVAVGVAMPSMRLPTPFYLSKNGFVIANPNPSLIQILPCPLRKTYSSSSSNRLLPSNHLPVLAMASAPSSSSSQTVAPGDVDSGSDFYQVIQAHQAAAARLPPIEEVRTVLDRSVRGMLSTFSQDLSANPKCSLLVAKDSEDMTDLVIVVHGDAVSVSENDREAVRAAYLKRHPDAFWVDFGDFQFMRIEPKVVRYVSGVATALLGSGEFEREEFKAAKVDPIAQFSVPVASHMNRDHADDTKAIVQHSTSVKVNSAHMLDLDSLGFNVKAGYQGSSLKLRIPFPRCAEDRK
ncbi:hypothetical protein ACLOJK_021101 [Asimina triloba]